jgi:hypothetical protein
MIAVDFPNPLFRRKNQNGAEYIFDEIRKKWILLTTEEWVRQNFVQYLVINKNYPKTLIALEKQMMLGELKKRFDILVYDKDHQPNMMVECKSPSVALNEAVLQQVLRYNISIPVNLILITNGNLTYGWKRNEEGLQLIDEIPPYNP